MNRVRRYLPPLLMLLPVIFICVKLLLTPVRGDDVIGGDFASIAPFEFGWPWEYRRANADFNAQTNSFDLGSTFRFSGWMLAADLAVLIGAAAVCWLLLAWWWRRSRYRLQFSLRACLLAMLVPALGLGWWMSHVRCFREEQRLSEQLQKFANAIPTHTSPAWLERFCSREQLEVFDHVDRLTVGGLFSEPLTEEGARTVLDVAAQLPYLRVIECQSGVRSTGKDGKLRGTPLITPARVPRAAALDRVERISFSYEYSDSFISREANNNDKDEYFETANDQTLQVLGQLPRLKRLNLRNCNVTDAGLANLRGCTSLEVLNLSHTKITDAGLRQLSACPLRELTLARCEITDEGLAHLANFRDLESLDLSRTKITSAGLSYLLRFQKLKQLDLDSTTITDEAIETIAKINSLEELSLDHCRAITSRNLLLLLECPKLGEVALPNLPGEAVAVEKQLKDALLPRFYKNMGVDGR